MHSYGVPKCTLSVIIDCGCGSQVTMTETDGFLSSSLTQFEKN